MCRSAYVALGVALGALAYPLGCAVGFVLFHRSWIYPKEA